jgi:hypothetical protein
MNCSAIAMQLCSLHGLSLRLLMSFEHLLTAIVKRAPILNRHIYRCFE